MYRNKNLVDCNFLCYKAQCPPATEREVLVDTEKVLSKDRVRVYLRGGMKIEQTREDLSRGISP